jgi:hypothetical protein
MLDIASEEVTFSGSLLDSEPTCPSQLEEGDAGGFLSDSSKISTVSEVASISYPERPSDSSESSTV